MLGSIRSGKSPGNDGISGISSLLIGKLSHSYQAGLLSTPQRWALTTLIEKKESTKVYQELETNLLNKSKCQISAKILAGRIKKELPNVVKHDQTAYVKGKCIGHSIGLISDTLEYTQENNIDRILFQI